VVLIRKTRVRRKKALATQLPLLLQEKGPGVEVGRRMKFRRRGRGR